MRAVTKFEQALRDAETRDFVRELTGAELRAELVRVSWRFVRIWAAAYLRLFGYPNRLQMLVRPLGMVMLALLIEAAIRFIS